MNGLEWVAAVYAVVLVLCIVSLLLDARWIRAVGRLVRRVTRAWIIWRYMGRPWRIAIKRAWRTEP